MHVTDLHLVSILVVVKCLLSCITRLVFRHGKGNTRSVFWHGKGMRL